MNKNLIELFKVREFGEYISEPISFLIKEFKLLSLTILLFIGPIIVFYTFLLRKYGIGIDMDFYNMFRYGGNLQDLASYRIPYFLQLISLLQTIVLYTVIAIYIKLYVQRGIGNFSLSDIWDEFKKLFGTTLVAMILAAVMMFFGFFILILPGIYLAVVFYLIVPIVVFEEVKFGKAISRSFEITKGKWWTTFGAFIVMAILAGIINLIVSYILGLILSIGGTGALAGGISSAIIQIISVIITSVTSILPVFLYTSYITEKEDPILLNRINDINEDQSDVNIFETLNETAKNNREQADKQEEEDWDQLLDDEEKKNRFDDDSDEDRFKPKY